MNLPLFKPSLFKQSMEIFGKKPQKPEPKPEKPTEIKELRARLQELEDLTLEQSTRITQINAQLARINGTKGGRPLKMPEINPDILYESPTNIVLKSGQIIPKTLNGASNADHK